MKTKHYEKCLFSVFKLSIKTKRRADTLYGKTLPKTRDLSVFQNHKMLTKYTVWGNEMILTETCIMSFQLPR